MSKYLVRAGSNFTDRDGSIHRVQSIYLHPEYNKKRSEDNDVALLQLYNPILLDNVTKRFIKLFESNRKIQDGTIATVSGWGDLAPNVTNHGQLQRLDMKMVDKKNCTNIFETYVSGEFYAGLHEGQICATSSNRDIYKSFCDGDSGWPLVIDDKLPGIVSTSAVNCTSKPIPNIFTEIAYFRKWIDEMMDEFL